jgi:hypothetical protein
MFIYIYTSDYKYVYKPKILNNQKEKLILNNKSNYVNLICRLILNK